MHKLTKELLEKAKSEHKIVSVFTDCNDLSFCYVGFVHSVTDSHLLLESTYNDGSEDGFIVCNLDNIHRIDYDGYYERKIMFIYQQKKQRHNKISPSVTKHDGNLLLTMLELSKSKNYIVKVRNDEDEKEGIVGYVNRIGEDEVEIKIVSSYGEDNGLTVLPLCEIFELGCNRGDERIRVLLLNWKPE